MKIAHGFAHLLDFLYKDFVCGLALVDGVWRRHGEADFVWAKRTCMVAKRIIEEIGEAGLMCAQRT